MNTNTTNNPYDDAELARALQEEYEREYRRRSMQQHLSLSGDSGTGTPRNANRDSNRNSNTNSNTNTRSINTARRSPTNAFARPPRSTQLTPTAPIASPSSSSPSHQQQQQQQTDVFEDPFYAPNYTLSAASFSSTPPSQHQQQHHQEQGPFYVLSGDSFGSVEVSDAAYARQLEQEMRLQQEQEDKEEAEAERTRRQARKQHLQDQRDSFRATRSSSFGRSSSGNSNLNANANANATHNNNITRPNLSHAQSYSTTYTSHSEASSMRPPERPTLQETSTATGTNTGSNSSSSSGPHQQQQSRSTRNIHNNSNYNNTNNHNSSQYASSSGYAHRDRDFPEQPIPQNNNAFTTTSSTSADEEYAWRLEQEMRDEEFARQAFVEDQIRQSSIAAQAIRGRNVTSSSRGQQQQRSPALSRRRKLCSCCATLLLSVALTALLFYFFVGKDTLNMSPDEFRAEDPFNNANKEDANLWDTPKGDMGLELSIINALDSNWHDSFYLAVDQWDAGTPDALTLDTEVWEPESVCKPETGKLKVCNGDYGETNWRGINKVMLENGLIYSSAARMNDYYSDDKNLAQKQYTMCHEMGHGFGLPHTDENFFNKDLNNCMDYTNNPENNKQPAEPNFKFLAQLYGTVDGSPVPTDDPVTIETNSTVTTSAADPNDVEEEEDETRSWKDVLKFWDRRRQLRQQLSAVAWAVDELDALIDNGSLFGIENENKNNNGWRRLHESSRGESHEFDLGQGFAVQIYLLR